jgi:hypothetical protein
VGPPAALPAFALNLLAGMLCPPSTVMLLTLQVVMDEQLRREGGTAVAAIEGMQQACTAHGHACRRQAPRADEWVCCGAESRGEASSAAATALKAASKERPRCWWLWTSSILHWSASVALHTGAAVVHDAAQIEHLLARQTVRVISEER